MLRKGRILVGLLLAAGSGFAQSLSLTALGSLPAVLSESSGLETSVGGGFWLHNDSGNEPELYRIGPDGNLTRTLRIAGAGNVDWEDLARSNNGYLYIGDFGNNANNRSNLVIYRIPDPDGWPSDTIPAEAIHFSYPDQYAFPPPPARQNFDMEAMVHLGGKLYLFSKNRTEPFSGYSSVYRLPDVPGTYVAERVDSFYTGPGPALAYWITGADVSPDGSSLVLTAHDKIWLFQCRNGRSFLDAPVQQLSLGTFFQREAVVFSDPETLVFTSEALSTFIPPQWFSASLDDVLLQDCCPAPEGLVAQVSGPGNLRFRWHPVEGAGAYRLRLSGSDGSVLQKTGSDTLQIFPDPAAAVTYRAYVQARCGNQVSGSSDTTVVSAPLRLAFANAEAALYATPEAWIWRATEPGHLLVAGIDGHTLFEGDVAENAVLPLPEAYRSLLFWRWFPTEISRQAETGAVSGVVTPALP